MYWILLRQLGVGVGVCPPPYTLGITQYAGDSLLNLMLLGPQHIDKGSSEVVCGCDMVEQSSSPALLGNL